MKVFISYSHKDSDFVEKLYRDLNFSDIPALYDKWILNVGDSIIQKISEFVSESDYVIAILSNNSVQSSWVYKELSISITEEINNKRIKVLPVLIDYCKVPPMLGDKLFVNFMYGYYDGLRSLVATISPSLYNRHYDYFERRSNQEKRLLILKEHILSKDVNIIKRFLTENDFLLAALLGELWNVTESVPNFKFNEASDNEIVDFIVVNGQSFSYELSLTSLMAVDYNSKELSIVVNEIERLKRIKETCYLHENDFRTILALRMKDGYGADQICPAGEFSQGDRKHSRMPLNLRIIILSGKRQDYDNASNQIRNKIYLESHRDIEIITYDRLLESIEKSFSR